MRLLVVLVSPDKAVVEYFAIRKSGALVRSETVSRGYFSNRKVQTDLCAFKPKQVRTASELTNFVKYKSVCADAVIVLFDQTEENLVEGLSEAAFLVPFDGAMAAKNPQNFFQQILARALRNFGAFCAHFDDFRTQKPLLLPLRNFHADEVNNLVSTMTGRILAAEFGVELSISLTALLRRQRPKPARRRRQTYLVDDRNRFFEYGHEEHSAIETGPPHVSRCELNGHFRFGRRFEPKRHFNVSNEGRRDPLQGEFLNCHGISEQVTRPTHLNLFPNGYYT